MNQQGKSVIADPQTPTFIKDCLLEIDRMVSRGMHKSHSQFATALAFMVGREAARLASAKVGVKRADALLARLSRTKIELMSIRADEAIFYGMSPVQLQAYGIHAAKLSAIVEDWKDSMMKS